MCGRFVSKDEATLERYFNLTRGGVAPLGPVYNAAPTLQLPIYRVHRERGPELVRLRWGLIPYWAKDISIGVKTINARAESIDEKPAFKEAFRRRRCLVPMAGFYEWQKTPAGKIPHFVCPLNGELFTVAGLYERWRPKEGGETIETFTIVTTEANEAVAKLHD